MEVNDADDQRRAELLAEAASKANQLHELLEQAGAVKVTGYGSTKSRIDTEAALAADLARTGAPLTGRELYPHDRPRERPIIRLLVDESGVAYDIRDDPQSDWFVLGAVAMTDAACDEYRANADQIKMEFFREGASVVFHASEMREAMRGGSGARSKYALRPGKSWREVMQALDLLIERTEFTAFGVVIRKWVFHQEFTETGKDPFLPRETYGLALHLLLERFLVFLASAVGSPIGSITLESQNPEMDARHQVSIAETIAYGTRWVSPQPLQLDIRPGVTFMGKQASHPLELSDILANLLYQWVRSGCYDDQRPRLGKHGTPQLWESFCSRFHQEGDLRRGRFGLKVFPDSGLEGLLDQHRKWCQSKRVASQRD